MPAVRKNESRNSYVNRAIDYLVHKEGLHWRQAVGKAEGMYDSAKKKKEKK